MDAMITAAARALAAGDPLGALKRVALRDDAPALALRGIAMAQLGDFSRAKTLVRRAARAFGSKEAVERARCVVAEAEIALAARELGFSTKTLDGARRILEAHGDLVNAAHARYLGLRRLLLIGRLSEAERLLASLAPRALPPALQAIHWLAVAGIALRRLDMRTVHDALDDALRSARQSRIPALIGEVESVTAGLAEPAARILARGAERQVSLEEVASLSASPAFVVDACRHVVRSGAAVVALARRPILFALAQALAEASPDEVTREALVARAFQTPRLNESHRARLRVEIGRLRSLLRPVAEVRATPRGFALTPSPTAEVLVLAPVVDEPHAQVLALLADGEAWSSSALALALGASQRTVQRALDNLRAAGKVQAFGKARARRWLMTPVPAFTTTLLLPASLPSA